MKILAVSHGESKYFYDFYQEGKLDQVDLIIGCGDLKAAYLDFLTTMAHCPVLYVKGNHDFRYAERSPEGSICIEDRIYVYKGIRILGLGGSMKYNGEAPYQYSEREMRRRMLKLIPQLIRYRGFDVLVTHAPARHLGDSDEVVHKGYETFVKLLDRFRPKYHLYGHVHADYGSCFVRRLEYHDTVLYNCYDKVLLDYESGEDVFGEESARFADEFLAKMGKDQCM